MTVREFEAFIESFNKEPGKYDADEIYEIGIAHKSLIGKNKNWEKLAKVLGVNKSGNALRSNVNYRLSKEGKLPLNPSLVKNENVEDLSLEDIGDVITAKTQALYVQQTKTRDTLNSYRRAMRDEARVDTFKEGLIDAIKTLEVLPTTAIVPINTNEAYKEAILMFSDLHLGVSCANFYNKYNPDIAIKRVNLLVDRTIKYCQDHKIRRLNFLNMGDLVQGIIHTNARIEVSLDITQQIMQAAEIVANAVYRLQKVVPEVVYRSVVDNHSRAMANKYEHIEKENFNKIIDWYVEERLKHTNVIFANDNLDDGLGLFKLYNGAVVMFAHGHQDSKSPAKMFSNYVGATGQFIDYALISHYHSEFNSSHQNFRLIINGSIVGTEEYALSKRLFNRPSQKLLIFEGNDVIDISIELNVQE